MSNLKKWQNMLSGIGSPDLFIEAGFYYMIAAALQRRVWEGTEAYQVYPNQFVILVGDAGVGKGLVIKAVSKMLKYHKLKLEDNNKCEDFIDMLDAVEDAKKKMKSESLNQLFVSGSSDVTYEALLKSLGGSMRGINNGPTKEKTWFAPSGKYIHKSMYFCIEEMSSLFKKDAEKVCNFLLCAYDSGDYEYETKHQGIDRIRKMCISFIAGTTPTYMQETFEDKILTDGFSSRTFFIFEFANRKKVFTIPPFDDAQKKDQADILAHLRKLAELVGPVTFTPEGEELLRSVYEDKSSEQTRPNKSFRLNGYYERKNQHLKKLAMAVHFADHTDMVITYEDCVKAVDYLARIEQKMHHALHIGSNRLARVAANMIKYIKLHKKVSKKAVYVEFLNELKDQDFDEVLKYIVDMSNIVTMVDEQDANGKLITYLMMSQDVQ